VVWTTNPWEAATCRCGAVAVSGLPWRPRVDWFASAPGGWSFVEDWPSEDEAPGEDSAVEDDGSPTA
jgi:hypothetical protein